MKRFLLYISYGAVACSIATKIVPQPENHYIQGSNNVFDQRLAPVINNTVTTVNSIELMITVATTIKNTLSTIADKITNYDYQSLNNLLKNYLWEKRYTIGAYSAGSMYAALSSYLFIEYYTYVNSGQLWANWKPDCSLSMLYEIPQNQLGHELILAIQAHNLDSKNPINFVQPLITFIYTIDIEIKRLERYLKITHAIRRLHVSYIFLINEKKISHAQALLERTQFIKHIFLSWLAEHNVAALQMQ